MTDGKTNPFTSGFSTQNLQNKQSAETQYGGPRCFQCKNRKSVDTNIFHLPISFETNQLTLSCFQQMLRVSIRMALLNGLPLSLKLLSDTQQYIDIDV